MPASTTTDLTERLVLRGADLRTKVLALLAASERGELFVARDGGYHKYEDAGLRVASGEFALAMQAVEEAGPNVEQPWHDAGRLAVWAADLLATAPNLGTQADAFVKLTSATSDLATFIPGYNERTGELDSRCHAETDCLGFMRPEGDGEQCDICNHFEL